MSALAHDSHAITQQAYYTDTKESQRPTVRQLLNDTSLYNQQLTLDALHLNPLTLHAIEGAGGVYLIGLKSNQAHLYQYCVCSSVVHKATYERSDAPQRGHCRVDQRSYSCFKLAAMGSAPRWKKTGMSTLIVVRRTRQALDGRQSSQTLSYFVSNAEPVNQVEAHDLFDAIRPHWRIEAMHYRRDVTLAEDALRTGSQAVSRLMSSLRTLTINLLKRAKPKNMAAQLDEFADKFHSLGQFMTQELLL